MEKKESHLVQKSDGVWEANNLYSTSGDGHLWDFNLEYNLKEDSERILYDSNQFNFGDSENIDSYIEQDREAEKPNENIYDTGCRPEEEQRVTHDNQSHHVGMDVEFDFCFAAAENVAMDTASETPQPKTSDVEPENTNRSTFTRAYELKIESSGLAGTGERRRSRSKIRDLYENDSKVYSFKGTFFHSLPLSIRYIYAIFDANHPVQVSACTHK